MKQAFEVKDVYKHFGDVKALDGVTLKAEEGKIFGLLGPNGAGKTTLIRMLSTLINPDKGSMEVLGVDTTENPQAVREMIGLAGQFAAVDEYLTGYENIYMTGRLYHLSHAEAKARAEKLLERLNLTKAAKRQVKTYSGGMRRRLDLGSSLVGEPKILFLDEPTTGLDPRTRLDLWKIIRDLVAGGTTILLTTQYLEEADELADKIAVINEGKIIAEGTSDQLKDQLGGDIVEFELENESDVERALAAVKPLAKKPPKFDKERKLVTVPVTDGSKSLMGIVQALNNAKITASSLSLHRPSLDDVFLALTGERVHEKPNDADKKKKRKK
ncbi:MAG TPA: ATP-binding cassette domain-containing protein [Gammaproteobacteria bacterium]|nr:ATP-binding cassette domain-containing protein [Gammaproteobacteria bacterium]